MKKIMLLCAAVAVGVSFTSCKSSESAYRKAYEKAKAQEQTVVETPVQANEQVTVVTPVVTKPATETTVVTNADNVPVRSEQLSIVSGSGLKAFSVVVGSFSVKANAEGRQADLRAKGYDAQVAFNSAIGMYRVIASTFDTKEAAVVSRDGLRSQFPDAWLLYQK